MNIPTNAQQSLLEAIADATEQIMADCGLPGQIEGGGVGNDHIHFVVRWECDPLQHKRRCVALGKRLRDSFGFRSAGVDADNPSNLWLRKRANGGRALTT